MAISSAVVSIDLLLRKCFISKFLEAHVHRECSWSRRLARHGDGRRTQGWTPSGASGLQGPSPSPSLPVKKDPQTSELSGRLETDMFRRVGGLV
ncbi:unnamed protein product [Arctogadus glacialis]